MYWPSCSSSIGLFENTHGEDAPSSCQFPRTVRLPPKSNARRFLNSRKVVRSPGIRSHRPWPLSIMAPIGRGDEAGGTSPIAEARTGPENVARRPLGRNYFRAGGPVSEKRLPGGVGRTLALSRRGLLTAHESRNVVIGLGTGAWFLGEPNSIRRGRLINIVVE